MKKIILISLLFITIQSRNLRIVNYCSDDIWIGAQGDPLPSEDSGFLLSAGNSRTLILPNNWASGRIWARTGCSWKTDPSWGTGFGSNRFVCDTGDCGSAANGWGEQCQGIGGQSPATLAEFTFNPTPGTDFYDISNVDGYSIPVGINVISGKKVPNFGDPEKYNCGSPSCTMNSDWCPEELTMFRNGSKYCANLCSAVTDFEHSEKFNFLKTIRENPDLRALVCCDCWEGPMPADCASRKCYGDKNCCGCFNPQSKYCCSPYDFTLNNVGGRCRIENWPKVQSGYFLGKSYSDVFKNQCPDAYSWQFDDLKSTYQCQDADYEVQFCGVSVSSGSTQTNNPNPPPPTNNPPPPPPQNNPPQNNPSQNNPPQNNPSQNNPSQNNPSPTQKCSGQCLIGGFSGWCDPSLKSCPPCWIKTNDNWSCFEFVDSVNKVCDNWAGIIDCTRSSNAEEGDQKNLQNEENSGGGKNRRYFFIVGFLGVGFLVVVVVVIVGMVIFSRRREIETV